MKSNKHLFARAAFTMVELLMVIGLIALLTAITVGSVGSIGGGRSLANTGSSLRDLLSQGRNLARSHNSLTLFVTPTTGDDARKIFSVYELRNDETTWSQVTKWERLAEGIVLDTQGSSTFLNTATATINIALPTIRQAKTTYNKGSYAFVLFSPNGQEAHSGVPLKLHLRPEPQKGNNYYEIVVNNTTGIPYIKRP